MFIYIIFYFSRCRIKFLSIYSSKLNHIFNVLFIMLFYEKWFYISIYSF